MLAGLEMKIKQNFGLGVRPGVLSGVHDRPVIQIIGRKEFLQDPLRLGAVLTRFLQGQVKLS